MILHDTNIRVPRRLAITCSSTPQRAAWLELLPTTVRALKRRWGLTLGRVIGEDEATCAFVMEAHLADGTPAVLKLGMPHMEGEHEIAGLRFWDGEPTIRLLEADEDLGAMVLERCEPGTPLRSLDEEAQDVVIAGLLRRLWRTPLPPHPFRPLAEMTRAWGEEVLVQEDNWPDKGLVRAGLHLFGELPRTAPNEVLLATDLHAGNVLKAEREPWLVIDPKPFVGDPAYDATQHLFNCIDRLSADPKMTIRRLADLLELDVERVRLWMFARAAVNSSDDWEGDGSLALARALAP